MRLGIDFGTTRTVVAVARDGRHPLVAFDLGDESHDFVPGTAAMVQGELVVGWPAARAVAAGTATHAIRSIKRAAASLPPDAAVPGLPGISALDLVTAFLGELRNLILDASNAEASGPLEAMVSVPANASSRQRWLTMEAFRRAGFQPIGLVNEPTAAAIELAHRHLAELGPKSKKRYVVVYDLGGGTFDASAVSLEGRRFDLIATEGLSRLGGDDFDDIILAAAQEQLGLPRVADAAALERAREAKEGLRSTSKKLLVDLGAAGAAQLDLADIYARCQSLVDRTIAQTDLLFERLRAHGIDPDDNRELGGVYLVGGAAAFPAVSRALRQRFGKKLQLAPQPFASTAIGLALAADPGANVLVREAVTRHFGVWREGDAGADRVFDPLIGKGAAIDPGGTVERRYRARHTVGHLRFVECGDLDAAGQPVQDLVPWADILFPYEGDVADPELEAVPIERRDQPLDEIAETYTVQPDGSIVVTIANVARGYARTYDLGALR
jgi:molecular chaperone DnaK (HSP70)|nr:Hsp70 family protein [Kofleriaceae bacterium]